MTTTNDPVVIVSAVRTPMGGFQGDFAALTAPQLGGVAIKAAVERAGISAESIEEVIFGCVLPAGLGQAPARQAALGGGLPLSAGCTTVNKMCGSGMKATMLAHDLLLAGTNRVMVAGGMESMSNVPYLLPQARTGYRLGNGALVDGLVHDGLWDPYNNFHMGSAGELCARECQIPRDRQDAYAADSYRRAQAAVKEGKFRDEIVAVQVPSRKGPPTTVAEDEQPFKGDPDKLASLRPAFDKNGTITAGNASTLNDGASALVVMSREEADRRGITPLATITGYAGHAQAPEWFTTAPAGAIATLLQKQGLTADDVDLWELNEAFAVVALVNQDRVGIDPARLNTRGGAIALGHPIGCSGARVLTTLLYALKQDGKRRGVASLCIGGGEAVALMVER